MTDQVGASDSAGSRRPALVIVLLATFMGGLDTYIVNLALPSIAEAFATDVSVVQWVPLAYLLAIAGLVVSAGRGSDLWGSRSVLTAGLIIFSTASAGAAVSPGLWWLVAARGAQGAGAAMMLAAGQAAVAALYTEGERGRALAWLHVAVSAGFVAGPLIGGALIDGVGWRAVFVVNVGVGVATAAAAWRYMPRTRRGATGFDLAGSVTLLTALVLLLLGMTRARSAGWGALDVAPVLAGGIGVLAAFVAIERRASHPLISLDLLRNRAFSVGLLAAFLTFVAMASNMLLVPFLLRDLLQRSAAQTGLVMIAVPLTILWVAPLAGRLTDRLGARLPATAGLAAVSTAILLLGGVDAGTAAPTVAAILVLYGLGAGLFQAPNNAAVLNAAPATQLGLASGALVTMRQLGQVVGVALAATLLDARDAAYAASATEAEALGLAFRDTFVVLAAIGAAATVVSWLRGPVRRRRSARVVRVGSRPARRAGDR